MTISTLATDEPTPAREGFDRGMEAALGTLAMSIVHDLRSPLAAIHVGAEMLNHSQLPEREVRRLASNIHRASVRIQEMLQDYVDLSQLQGNRWRPSDLRDLVAEAIHGIAAAAEARSVEVAQDVPEDLVVTLDHNRIRSVLDNLLANALEAMPAGGSIHISAAAEESSVVVRVRDTGPGIPPEIRGRLFQPFVTARKPGGWGLGLAHARQAVVEHGGEMWLESPPGRGACLGFSLPVARSGFYQVGSSRG